MISKTITSVDFHPVVTQVFLHCFSSNQIVLHSLPSSIKCHLKTLCSKVLHHTASVYSWLPLGKLSYHSPTRQWMATEKPLYFSLETAQFPLKRKRQVLPERASQRSVLLAISSEPSAVICTGRKKATLASQNYIELPSLQLN